MKKEMLINVLQPEECRIAILEDGTLEELYVERTSQESYVGNVYKGKIVNIEPSIQAAFVDFGIGRNGFLHVSDVDPAYYRHLTGGHEGRGAGPRRRDVRGGDPRRSSRDRDRGRGPKPPRHQDEFADYDAPPARVPPSRPPVDDFDSIGGFQAPRRHDERTAPPPPPDDRARFDDEFEGLLDAPQPRREYHAPPRHEPVPSADEYRTPVAGGGDDPYAGLLHELGGVPVHEPFSEAGADEPEGSEADRGRRPSRRRRGKVDEQPVPQHAQTPPPLPPQRAEPSRQPEPKPAFDDASFGAGIDLWGDDLPPPYVRGVDRRTEIEDDFESDPPFAGGRDNDDDDDSEAPAGPSSRPGPRDRPYGRSSRRGRDDGDGAPKPNIQDIFKRGQEVLVQVIKEGIGTKGPTLSTYISIAGRYLVLMPGLSRIGVSRKIADDEQRRRLKDILTELKPPPGLGFIIRTAGTDRNKKELQNDLAYLLRIWQVVVRKIKQQKGPTAIHQESDMITRTIRDTFTADVDSIWIDEKEAFLHAQEFLQGVMPRYASRLKLYESAEPLFHKYGIESEIAKIQQKKLPLPNGGSIVIEQTEALVAIDVNSGNFRADSNNSEETAYQINLQAAKEIARQLRLRDLGGVIVNDFIDMKDEKHRRGLERAMRDAVKRDRARTKLLRISQFGLIEMTRQRIRPSLKRSVYQDCPHCNGIGHVKTTESMSIEAVRLIQLASHREQIRRIDLKVHAEVANYLLNRRRRELARLEDQGGLQVSVTGLREVSPERLEVVCYDAMNNEVPLLPTEQRPRPEPRSNHSGRGRR